MFGRKLTGTNHFSVRRDSADIPCWCTCRESPVWIKRLHFKRVSGIGPLLLKLVSFTELANKLTQLD